MKDLDKLERGLITAYLIAAAIVVIFGLFVAGWYVEVGVTVGICLLVCLGYWLTERSVDDETHL